MKNDFEVVSEFCCHGKQMVTVRNGNAAHVISKEEWNKVYGRNHQDIRGKKVAGNRFVSKQKYNRCKVKVS